MTNCPSKYAHFIAVIVSIEVGRCFLLRKKKCCGILVFKKKRGLLSGAELSQTSVLIGPVLHMTRHFDTTFSLSS